MAHVCWRILLILTALLAFAACLFFNYLSSTPLGREWGLYESSQRNVSDKFYLEITPAGWTFTIWAFIYTYQLIWLIYGITTIFRKNKSGGHLYYDPPYMSPLLYIIFIINMGLNVSWIFLFDRELIWPALIPIALAGWTLYIMVAISARDLEKYKDDIAVSVGEREFWLVRFLVHNAWGMYASWVTIATLLNMGMVMAYVGSVPQHIASTVCLCVLAIEAVVYFLLDNFALDRHLRYMVTPYIVLHVALIGSLSKNWNPNNSNSILTLTLLVLGATLTCIKAGILIWRHRRKPLTV